METNNIFPIPAAAEQEPETIVIFRRFRNGEKEVIAVFPYECETNYRCMSYMHVGQHSAADYHALMDITKPASLEDEDVKNLKKELERTPYNYRFKVAKRVNSTLLVKARKAFRMRYAKEKLSE